MVVFTFWVFDLRYSICQISIQNLKFFVLSEIWCLDYLDDAKLNGAIEFFVLGLEYLFWAKLVQKIKFFSLSWNLVPRLIRI